MSASSSANSVGSSRPGRLREYALAALDKEAEAVSATPDGAGRNPRLNQAAFALGQIIAGAPEALSADEAEQRLLKAATGAMHPASKARETIRRALRAGMAQPRDLTSIGITAGHSARSRAANTPPQAAAAFCRSDDDNRGRARELWNAAVPAIGTPAETYFRSRGLIGELPGALRFHRDVPMRDTGRHPCIIAAVTVPTSGELLAVQRTALRADGSGKAAIEPAKASLGGTRGGAVVLGDLAANADPIIEGEGVETVLAGCDAIGWTGVATLSCEALGRSPLPRGRPIVILVDRGAEAKARAGAKRRHDEGRAVRLASVPDDLRPGERGVDANDLLRERGHDAVRAMIEAAAPFRPDPLPPAALPDGFGRLANGWITWTIKTKDGDEIEEPLCSPIEFLAATRDGDDRAWGLLTRIQNRDGRWIEWAMPNAWLAGDGREIRSDLLAAGLQLTPGNGARNALGRLLASVAPDARARSVVRLGWHGRAFVLPDGAIGDTEGERIVWQPEIRVTHAYRTSGSLDGWRACVAAPAAGNSRLVLALSSAFAAPLLGLLGMESGGFHFRGSSSIGKTTLLRVAGSAWGGGGLDGYIRRWKATANGLEGVATLHSDGLLCLDELAEIEARDAYQAGYMLANGQGKQRARSGGEARAPATWRVLFLSTGELSLADKIAEDGRRATAGQEVRVVDLPADAGAGLGLFERLHDAADADAFARNLKDAAAMHYGHPARAFLDALAHDLDGAAGLVRESKRRFEQAQRPKGASGQVLRVLSRFALVAAAGELAAHYRVLPWRSGEAIAGVARCWSDWIASRGGSGDQEGERAIAQVRAFIEAHGASRFEPLTGAPGGARDRVGFVGPGADGERRWYVLREAWRAVCAGLDPAATARRLAERGMLEHDPGTYQLRAPERIQKALGATKRARVYAVTGALFEGDRDDN